MIVRKLIDLNAPLTQEQQAELDALENLSDDDIVFDEDCPPITETQSKLFKRASDRRKIAV